MPDVTLVSSLVSGTIGVTMAVIVYTSSGEAGLWRFLVCLLFVLGVVIAHIVWIYHRSVTTS